MTLGTPLEVAAPCRRGRSPSVSLHDMSSSQSQAPLAQQDPGSAGRAAPGRVAPSDETDASFGSAIPVLEGLFVEAEGEVRLLGSECTHCGVITFPRQSTCPGAPRWRFASAC